MGKSYKKTPVRKYIFKGAKKHANARLRHLNDVSNGALFKRFSSSWDIIDERSYFSLSKHCFEYDSWLKEFENGVTRSNPVLEKYASVNYWAKEYLRK